MRNPFMSNRRRDTTQMQSPSQILPSFGKGGLSKQKRIEPQGLKLSNQDLQSSNFKEEKYLWSIKEVVDQGNTKVALVLNLTKQPGQKRRFLAIQSIRTLLLQYPGSDFPNAVYLSCNSLDGYSTASGLSTHIVGSAFPIIGATVLKAGFSISNITYQSDRAQELWDITDVSNITLNVIVQGQPIDMPLQNPILVKAKIVRVII